MGPVLPTEPPVMTVIPYRTGATMKAHATMGRARAAVVAQQRGRPACVPAARIYVWRDGAWALEHTIEQGTLVADLPWKKAA